ncbi:MULTISPECIES: hypothetical protein [unclassified Coleofasciculus]|uniref:hypothetical protein n=1 Tax=unclassified Coleofasciculus TaxID=2692782 RepID=UPI001880A260|nr:MULTISPECIES: hypothetical protein [unclassified Coleofasciculus]MBE9129620.1 hypothetical protein [Coleofasciculus sp. LEGE 07081]MBE9152154.1 hypothetical protein [Coleofasciculus sp. LEGE 07092]
MPTLVLFVFSLSVGCHTSLAQLLQKKSEEAVAMTAKSIPATEPIQVVCSSITNDEGQRSVAYQIENVSDSTIHIFDSQRMPYLLQQDDETLVVLHGVNSPDPDKDYYAIEIPITKPVEPGEVVNYEVSLMPLYLKDHYETQRNPTELQGSVTVRCQVGWGETPILASERHTKSINSLLEWQHITEAEPIEVKLP